jgi:hypothetical protein
LETQLHNGGIGKAARRTNKGRASATISTVISTHFRIVFSTITKAIFNMRIGTSSLQLGTLIIQYESVRI